MAAELSLQSRLEDQIEQMQAGQIFFPTDFLELGKSTAVHMALSRLEGKKKFTRLGKGIYVKFKKDPVLGPVLPSLDNIAHAIAEKEKVIIRPTGSHALNRLGLSTQIPTKVVYLTNGSRRRIKIGRGTITFKPTTPKNLAAKNELIFLAIQSLIELEPAGISKKVIETLTQKLKDIPVTEIREDARSAPQFVSQTLLTIANTLSRKE